MKVRLNPQLVRRFQKPAKKAKSGSESPRLPVSKSSSSCPSEHEEQKALMIWAVAQVGRGVSALALLFAVPNGGDRHPAVAGKLRAEGVKSGVPDLMLPVPMSGHCGLFVEMKKRKGGTVSKNQAWWHERLRMSGYAVVVARGAEEAIKAINNYLAGRKADTGCE